MESPSRSIGEGLPKKQIDVPEYRAKNMLQEICDKRRWNHPSYEADPEDAAEGVKNGGFVVKVTVNGSVFQSKCKHVRKKDAEFDAAMVALESVFADCSLDSERRDQVGIQQDQDETIKRFEEQIGYIFQDKTNVKMALTHSSYAQEHRVSFDNGCLAFLGDRVLGLVAALQLYQTGRPVSKISTAFPGLTQNIECVKYAASIHLAQFLFLGNSYNNIRDDLPKEVLAGSFEAVMGAIFIDSHQDFTKCREFFERNCKRN